MNRWIAAIGVAMAVTSWAEPSVQVISPRPYMVIQREGFVPSEAHANALGGPALGFADVAIDASLAGAGGASIEARVVRHKSTEDGSTPWTPLATSGEASDRVAGSLRVGAGGWYRLEIRARKGNEVVASGAVEPFGVGEVFLIAGQSYATNTNEERMRITDPAERVASLNSATKTWSIAHDPQPAPDGSDGGSIWPVFGDALVSAADVPIGLANVAVGGTSSTQWLPGGELHQRLVEVGKHLDRFRAVLWQQGESDVIGHAPTADYVKRLEAIRSDAARAWKFEPVWLLAKSTLHPTVYIDPVGEGRIRGAVDELIQRPGFRPGPDTDILGGENRGPMKSRRHFSAVGQRRAGLLWFASVWQEINRPRPRHELLLRRLPELHLLEPARVGSIVHRESSVLMKATPDAPAIARLAFAAAEIIEIRIASTGEAIPIGPRASLADDGLTLKFKDPTPVPPILESDLFPGKDAPNSYRHRAGHPEQNLLYAPGVWFHDRNVEVTYRRAEAAPATKSGLAEEHLPKTLARLRARQPVTIGVSGDSISTGLDASALSAKFPYQPGYPDMLAAQLRATWQSEITLVNRAVGGWSIEHGVGDLDNLLREKPDLIIVAYGMNDVGRRDPAWFGQRAAEIVERVRQALPESEILFVSPMLGNKEWVHTPREMFAAYRDGLLPLLGPGVALADVTAAWENLIRNKHDLDMTGNGLNHPNDFGHRVYAQAILQRLCPELGQARNR